VETAVHVLAVVHRLPYVRQVFQNKNGILDRLGVVHDFAGDAVEHVVYLVPQVVTEGLRDTFATACLKSPRGGEVGPEPTNGLPFVVGP